MKIADLFVDLKLDTVGFDRELTTALKRASARTITVGINLDVDAGKAQAQLARVAQDRTSTVKVKVDGQKGINFAFKGVSNLTTAIAGLGASAIPVMSALTAGVGALGSAFISAGGAGGLFAASVGLQVKAIKEQQKIIKQQTDSLAKMTKGTKEYKEKAAQVASLQRDFNKEFGPTARGLDNAKVAMEGFREATGKVTLKVMGQGLSLFSKILPRLVPIANAAGRAIGGLLTELEKFSKTKQFQSILDFFQKNGPGAITSFGHIAGNIVLGVFNLFKSFAPYQQSLLNWIEQMSAKFKAWSATVGQSDGFKGWMDSVKANLPAIRDLVVDITQVIAKFVQGLGPLAALQFTGMTVLANALNKLPPKAFTAIATGIAAVVVGLKAWEIGSKAVAVAQGIASAATAIWTAVTNAASRAALGTRIQLALLAVQTTAVSVIQKAAAVATTVWTVAQRALNAVMRANPIGLIITAITALVGAAIYAYKHFETFRKIVDAAWAGIKKAAAAAWSFLKTVFSAIRNWIAGTLIPIFKRLWDYVKTAMTGIGKAIQFVWNNVVKPVFNLYKSYITNIVIPVIQRLWSFVKTAFTAVGKVISTVWSGVIKPVFDKLKSGVEGVKTVFDKVVTAIGKIWETLKGKFKEPIKVAFDFVNSKVVGPVNDVLAKLPGGLKIPGLPKLARGGPVWGAGTATSDSIPAMLSNGEYVVRAKQAQKHRGLLERINGGAPGFAAGGGIGDIWDKTKGAVSGAVNFGKEMIAKGARKAAEAILGPLQKGVNNLIGEPTNIARAMMRSTSDKLFKGVFGLADEKDKQLQKAKTSAAGAGGLGPAAPGKGLIAGGYTITSYPGSHHGYDLAVPVGTPIYAPWAGNITRSYDIPGYEPRQSHGGNGYRSYGRVVEATFSNGVHGLFAHLSARRGTGSVKAGTMMGRTGNTGNSSGPHLHVEGLTPAAFRNGGAVPAFANGGIVTKPTIGLIGEAGPEMILPFKKGGAVSAATAKRRAALRAQVVKLGADIKNGFDASTTGKTLRTLIRANYKGKAEKVMIKRLDHLVRLNTTLTKINKAQATLSGLRTQRKDFVGGLKDTIAPNIGDFASTPGGILAGLRGKAGAVKTFATAIKKLSAAGFPRALVMQVAGLGLVEGAAAANQLLALSAKDKKEVGTLFNQMVKDSGEGGVAGSIGNSLFGGSIAAATKALKKLPNEKSVVKAMNKLGSQIVDGMIKDLHLNPAKKKKGSSGGSKSGGGSGSSGGGGGGGGGSSPGGNSPKDIARRALNARGWGGQWNSLNQLVAHESSWNPKAENPTSSASGLFQFLDSTARAYGLGGHASRASVSAQVSAGLRYIKSRYGNPNGAWAFWQKHRWYDNGGWLEKGRTMAVNQSGRPEAILTANQWSQMERLISAVESGRTGNAPLIGHAVIRENVDLERYERQRAFRERRTRV